MLHTLRNGTRTYFKTNPIEGKVAGLFRGGDDGQTPRPICLKELLFQKVEILVLKKEQIAECINTDSTIKALDVEKADSKECQHIWSVMDSRRWMQKRCLIGWSTWMEMLLGKCVLKTLFAPHL